MSENAGETIKDLGLKVGDVLTQESQGQVISKNVVTEVSPDGTVRFKEGGWALAVLCRL